MQPILRPAIFFAFVLVLAACFEYDAVVRVNPDGSGKAEFVYRFPQGLLDKSDLAGKIPLSQKEVDAKYRMRAGVTQYRADFRDVAQFKEVRLFLDFDKVSSLSERGNAFSYDIEGGYRVFRVRIDREKTGAPSVAKSQGQINQQKMMRGVLDRYKITYKVYLPEKIDLSNAQKVEWNAATWEIPLSAFLADDKRVIVLEAKTKVGLWERLKWQVTRILG